MTFHPAIGISNTTTTAASVIACSRRSSPYTKTRPPQHIGIRHCSLVPYFCATRNGKLDTPWTAYPSLFVRFLAAQSQTTRAHACVVQADLVLRDHTTPVSWSSSNTPIRRHYPSAKLTLHSSTMCTASAIHAALYPSPYPRVPTKY